MNQDTIVVTGGTGFIGRKFVNKIIGSGYRVINIGRMLNKHPDQDGIRHVTWDQILERKEFEKINAMCIVHLATEYGRNTDLYSDALYANTYLPIRLLENCREFGVKKFINVDSFYCKNNNIYEKMPQYCATKNYFKLHGEQVAKSKGISFTTARLEHVYGENDNKDKFIPWLIQMMKDKKEPINLTDGSQMRDFIYVTDVVDGLMKIVTHHNSDVLEYELGTGNAIQLRSLVEKISLILKYPIEKINFGAVETHPNEIIKSLADLDEINSLGWTSKVSIDEGIKRTIFDDIK